MGCRAAYCAHTAGLSVVGLRWCLDSKDSRHRSVGYLAYPNRVRPPENSAGRFRHVLADMHTVAVGVGIRHLDRFSHSRLLSCPAVLPFYIGMAHICRTGCRFPRRDALVAFRFRFFRNAVCLYRDSRLFGNRTYTLCTLLRRHAGSQSVRRNPDQCTPYHVWPVRDEHRPRSSPVGSDSPIVEFRRAHVWFSGWFHRLSHSFELRDPIAPHSSTEGDWGVGPLCLNLRWLVVGWEWRSKQICRVEFLGW